MRQECVPGASICGNIEQNNQSLAGYMNRSDDLNTLDPTDLKILLELIRDPRVQIGELSEKLGIARNTAQSRVRRMLRSGILHDGGREIDLEAVGYDVVAFVTIEVTHRELEGVIRTETVLALHTHIPYRTEPLISRLVQSTGVQSAGTQSAAASPPLRPE